MAASKVFATTALLEKIFLHLPARDILFLQGTSKNFYNKVNESTALQRRMSCLIERAPVHPAQNNDMQERSEKNRLAERILNHIKNRVNALLFDERTNIFFDLNAKGNSHGYHITVSTTLARVKNEQHSFQQMFLTQPPVKSVTLEMKLTSFFDHSYKHTITSEVGVRVSDLVKVMREWAMIDDQEAKVTFGFD
ncbi:uncharacterized protein RCC_08838 [Ramularia collo-cygni]|uniref:F-box domain-containing protein n=1 Tax=Ramularia collo-cygni TaxID=112498 RepID=A0A2D3VN47_9PEZI|nr:uncharacterized protein RCC_08838 [Ramularia collo-cygni]CZT23128.1 uncharacterized protein RCC_08838 [Ramularia collo-cygni]